MTECELKNISKYNRVKIAKGVFLDSKETKQRRDSYSGISSEEFKKVWYMLPKGRAIFKSYESNEDTRFFRSLKNMRITNELLCYELAKQIGVLCAEYEPASYKGKNGIVTYDIVGKNEFIIDANSLFYNIYSDDANFNGSLYEYYKIINNLESWNYKIDKDKVLKDIYKIAIFDCLTAQSDRHSSNLLFLVNNRRKTLKVSPMIDNEFAFNVKNFDIYIHNLQIKQKSQEESFLDSLDYIECQIIVNNKEKIYQPKKSLYLENIEQICNIAKEYKDYAQILKDMLNSFNLKKVVEKVKAKGIKINKNYEDYIYMAEEQIKKIFRKAVYNMKYEEENKFNYLRFYDNENYRTK